MYIKVDNSYNSKILEGEIYLYNNNNNKNNNTILSINMYVVNYEGHRTAPFQLTLWRTYL